MNSQLWIVNSDANQHKDLIQESLVAENSYSLMFLMAEIQANWYQLEPPTLHYHYRWSYLLRM